PAPPAWAESLPLGFAVGPGEAFDEFSAPGTTPTTIPPSSQPGASAPTARAAGPWVGAADPANAPYLSETGPQAAGSPAAGVRVAHSPPSEGTGTTWDLGAGPGSGPRPPSREAMEGPLKAIQVHDSYLIAETGDGMMVIDQHALHERILYEELRQRVA